jgi:glycosyltransferase involved in cell wall biosynthesis
MRRRPGILKNFMLWYFKQLAYNGVMKAKKIISTQGKCSQMEFLRWFPSLPTGMFENIPSGIKIKKVLEDKTKENRNIILAVSRIYPIKRIDLLLRVFSDVVKYTDAELWIIGKEEKEEFIKLQNLLKELVKLNPRLIDKRGKMRIKFFGGIENKNLSEFYSKAKLLVNTSETEGICFSFLEAMLHKLPIVAWDVGGNNGVVDNGVTGYLHEFGDIERMSLSIQRLLSNTEKHKITRKAMGYAAFNKLKNNFDIEKNANKYLEVYQSILGHINFD